MYERLIFNMTQIFLNAEKLIKNISQVILILTVKLSNEWSATLTELSYLHLLQQIYVPINRAEKFVIIHTISALCMSMIFLSIASNNF